MSPLFPEQSVRSKVVDHSPDAAARFEVAHFVNGIGRLRENTVNCPNPKRQRGIVTNTAETQNLNPSLTQRVGMVANAQLQKWRVGLVGLVVLLLRLAHAVLPPKTSLPTSTCRGLDTLSLLIQGTWSKRASVRDIIQNCSDSITWRREFPQLVSPDYPAVFSWSQPS